MISTDALCPCGSNVRYTDCCGLYHNGVAAPNAGILMPSRYSAYVFKLTDYLLRTWHPSSRPDSLYFNQKEDYQWLGLEIKHYQVIDDQHATVEFIARYQLNGVRHHIHEISRFLLEEGCWYYVDGKFAVLQDK